MKTIKISDEIYEKIKGFVEDKPIKALTDLIGETYTFWCTRYIYHGKVKEVTKDYVVLENAGIVYETGELDSKSASDLQKLPNNCFIMVQSIESFQKMNW